MHLSAVATTRAGRLALLVGLAAGLVGLRTAPTALAVLLAVLVGVVITKMLAENHVALSGAERRLARMAADIADLRAAQRSYDTTIAQAVSDVERQLEDDAEGRTVALESIRAQVDRELTPRLDALSERVETDRRAGSPLLATYQPFHRLLEIGTLDALAKEWGERLDLELTRREMGYLAHRVAQLDDLARGRLASDTESALIRMLVARAVAKDRVEHGTVRVLEIGTLFGVGLGVVHEGLRVITDDVTLAVIDPLDGYYGGGRRDIITGQPITERVLRENLDSMGIGQGRVEVHVGLSGDVLPRLAEAGQQFDLVIIDGDHTYDGVRVDFEETLPVLAPGGVIIFDDYGTETWPDVATYVDEHVLTRPDMAAIGHHARTLAVRHI